MTVSCCLAPATNEVEGAMTEMYAKVTGSGVTETLIEPDVDLSVAVTVIEPGFIPVNSPVALIDATVESDVLQLTWAVRVLVL